MKKFLLWVIGVGGTAFLHQLKGKSDYFAKKLSASGDIPWVSEKNEEKAAKEMVDALLGMFEEFLKDIKK